MVLVDLPFAWQQIRIRHFIKVYELKPFDKVFVGTKLSRLFCWTLLGSCRLWAGYITFWVTRTGGGGHLASRNGISSFAWWNLAAGYREILEDTNWGPKLASRNDIARLLAEHSRYHDESRCVLQNSSDDPAGSPGMTLRVTAGSHGTTMCVATHSLSVGSGNLYELVTDGDGLGDINFLTFRFRQKSK